MAIENNKYLSCFGESKSSAITVNIVLLPELIENTKTIKLGTITNVNKIYLKYLVKKFPLMWIDV